MARLFAPPFALAGWALAAILGADPDLLRWLGPAVTGIACAVHIHEELRIFRAR